MVVFKCVLYIKITHGVNLIYGRDQCMFNNKYILK